MTMKIKGILTTKMSLKAKTDNIIAEGLDKASLSLLTELKRKTPVDTGEARDSWQRFAPSKQVVLITNDADHIESLNDGSSKQAPEYFIERTAVKYGRPLGLIVERKGN